MTPPGDYIFQIESIFVLDSRPFLAQKAKITGEKLVSRKESFVNQTSETTSTTQKLSPSAKKKTNFVESLEQSTLTEVDSEWKVPQKSDELKTDKSNAKTIQKE